MDVAEKTLKKIEEEHIKPEPRWHFILKDCSLWVAFIGSIFIGAIAISASIFMLTDQDWNVYRVLDRSLFKHILISLPYLWIIILLILMLLAYYNFKSTKGGYRYEMHTVVLCSILKTLGFWVYFIRWCLEK
jgi:ABC-type dipeptide/oligopeptide/nickel transport system permease component